MNTLTPREREVYYLIRLGLRDKEIGKTLGITTGTTKIHVSRILKKLGVRSRLEAAVLRRRAKAVQ